MKNLLSITLSLAVFLFCVFTTKHEKEIFNHEVEEGHAFDAFEYWYNQRATPNGVIPKDSYLRAVQYVHSSMPKEQDLNNKVADNSSWVSIGPDNVGGRTLAITFNPTDGNKVWIGASSGGLWKSTNGGFGSSGWTQVNTGYPTMAVSSIVIDPLNPDIMYIGTGEVGGGYKYRQIGTPGARTTYGMGILKSTDAGVTWMLTNLVWQFSQVTAVQRIVINPINPNTLFAATTEGIYKSVDAGITWSKVQNELMAMDIAIDPVDTTVLYASHGQSNTTLNPGLYKSTDAGASWAKLSGGLPSVNFGRTTLSLSQSNPQMLYASVANASSAQLMGLYKTTNGGVNWSRMPAPNYLGNQGWYDNVVAVHPTNPDIVICSGLDIYKSVNGGTSWAQKSYWYNGSMYDVPAGGPEGPPNYAHADHHAITFDPSNTNRVYFGCDGGVFYSGDIGEHFAGVNGGYVTTQFYNGFAIAETDSLIALGGLQDNGTVKYEGNKSWNKVFGGDGGWCAIDPTNSDIMYEEYVNLTISKSTNSGYNWFFIGSSIDYGDIGANFIAPFVIAPSDPQTLYAGASIVNKGYNGGAFWDVPSVPTRFNNTCVSSIGVSYQSSDSLMAGTGGAYLGGGAPSYEIFASGDGAGSWVNVSGSLPRRFPTDISFDRNSSRTVYITFSGYDTTHVFKTTNFGQTWVDISSNLPDVPTQSVVADPMYPDQIYVGTDLGVFRTLNGGASWHMYDKGMPPTMIVDLGISKTNRVLRAATHGNGIYERKLPSAPMVAQVNYRERWNLLSLPLNMPDKRKSILFPNATSLAYSYQGRYASDDTLSNGIAYFIKFPGPQTISFNGSPVYRDTIEVRQGWNMIGSISESVPTSSITTMPSNILNPNYYEFDGAYHLSQNILPGKGYWVKATQVGAMILNYQGNSKRNAVQTNAIERLNELNSITIEDASGIRQTLYFGEKENRRSQLSEFEMPPTPPSGTFDARFASQNMVELFSCNQKKVLSFPINIQATSYPLSVSWNIHDDRKVNYSLNDGRSVRIVPLKKNGSIKIIDPSVASLLLSVNNNLDVPKEYTLEQNYPNPFNPITKINFQLPQDSKVSLRVYDVIGNEVKVLVDGIETAGYHESQWDGSNNSNVTAASGIYFYRFMAVALEGGKDISFTRKMLLLK